MMGVVLALLAAFCYGIAATVQKQSMEDSHEFNIKGMIKDRVWLSSLIFGALGVLLYLGSISLEELTVVQPVLSISLVVPVIAGVTLFKEKLSLIQWLAVVLVIAGIVLVSI